MHSLEYKTKKQFFNRIDWASFWTATVLSFLVYFFTLGPSVGLEDSGELAVAGDHLGVPHPPGYPIWSIISWCFARVFGFVTFRGQPNPAWAIALGSAVFGALAAGCTAMLITRSAADMLKSMEDADERTDGGIFKSQTLLPFVGGVAGSLIFAFSPVMWSQSTIVEVYSLGAFFLMLVMLLTYRWMRTPTDRLLWITAFVFGLGLTNYQVLLLAALPLVVIIFLRNISLFRDFLIVTLPFALAGMILKLGSLNQQRDLPKRVPLLTEVPIPNGALVAAGVAALGLVLALALAWRLFGKRVTTRGQSDEAAGRMGRIAAIAAAILLGLSLFLLALAGTCAKLGVVGAENPANLALMEPVKYLHFGMLLAGVLGLSAIAAAFGDPKRLFKDPFFAFPVYGAALMAVIALTMAMAIPGAALPKNIDLSTVPTLGVGVYNIAFVLGLAMLVALSAAVPRSLLFSLPAAAIEAILYILIQKGVLLGLTHPSTWWFCAPAFFNFALLALAALAVPNGVSVAMTIFAGELGLSFYAYMPIVSDLRNPPMNWGYPRTWEGFKHAIMREQYEAIKPTNIFTTRFVNQVGDYFIDLRRQFTLLLAPFGFLPFAAWRAQTAKQPDQEKGKGLLKGLSAKPLVAGIVLLVMAAMLWGVDSFVAEDAIPDRIAVALRCFGAIALAASVAAFVASGLEPLFLACVFIGASVLFVVFGNIPAIERAFDASRIDKLFFGGMLLLGIIGGLLCACHQIAKAAVKMFSKKERTSGEPAPRGGAFSPLYDDISQQWMIGTFINFLVMSVVLIMLANPKGDLQDTFIQKVKFISSHGLFALWIGYGLVLALATLRKALGHMGAPGSVTKALFLLAVVAVAAAPLIPVEQNYFNDRLVFELSGAEQNGHDYGWQFGNYQLRGANAIREELEDDEEPLPNPLYPLEMGQGAVFFGGTDPGRFVPTYMIYSADVRPDVFLITQNALADNTFMSVTRDLYGDQLWIPTPKDSEDAFAEFVDDVRSGKRQANSDIVVENGRVQVVGALGVMEINGILCRKIFDHNKQWHDFFVEESYVIPWMYPYLTPHGLIMKINSERTQLSTKNVIDDMDFWDWYVRRITREGRYRRDIVAQKSFSKLRSAIAGLYFSRGRITDAERAYNDARVLYPVSPEATFRYVQDILIRQRRYGEALEAIEYFSRMDPNNERGPYVAGIIRQMSENETRLANLLAKRKAGETPPVSDALETAEILLKMGNASMAAETMRPYVGAAGLSVGECFKMADILEEAGDVVQAARAMDRIWRKDLVRKSPEKLGLAVRIYQAAGVVDKLSELLPIHLALSPGDWQAWLTMAGLESMSGRMDSAVAAMENAISKGGDQVLPTIEKSSALQAVLERLMQKRRTRQTGSMGFQPGLPGMK